MEAHFYNVSIHKAKTIFSRILKELYKRYDWRCFEQKQNYFMNGVYLVFLQLFIHFKIGHSHAGIVNISGANISHFVHFWLADTSMSFTKTLMKIAR